MNLQKTVNIFFKKHDIIYLYLILFLLVLVAYMFNTDVVGDFLR